MTVARMVAAAVEFVAENQRVDGAWTTGDKSIESTVTAPLNLLWLLKKATAWSEDTTACSWGCRTGLSALVQVWTSGELQHATDLVLSSTKLIRSTSRLHQRHFCELQQMHLRSTFLLGRGPPITVHTLSSPWHPPFPANCLVRDRKVRAGGLGSLTNAAG